MRGFFKCWHPNVAAGFEVPVPGRDFGGYQDFWVEKVQRRGKCWENKVFFGVGGLFFLGGRGGSLRGFCFPRFGKGEIGGDVGGAGWRWHHPPPEIWGVPKGLD